jgi:hypothetical protein
MQLPALLTIGTEYRPRDTSAAVSKEVRGNCFHGKVVQAFKWTADDIGADPKRIGLINSPTIVGSGIDIGKPPVQKTLGTSLVVQKAIGKVDFEGKTYGPFARGDLAAGLPDGLVSKLKSDGEVGAFDLTMLAEELTA